MQKLPIGITSFAEIRQGDYAYVDKTGLAATMLNQGKYYFLSRPRRFGKSLLVDTLKEMLEGNRKLFQGLAAEHTWDWTQTAPVIHISLAGGIAHSPEQVQHQLKFALHENAKRLGVDFNQAPYFDPDNPTDLLRILITQAKEKYQTRVAVLIDEYDKPLLDNLTADQATPIQDVLRGFYSTLKDSDAYLRFVFLTGVSKFSHVSVFSGLNNLQDITLDPSYTTLCGYTQEELESTFSQQLTDVDLELMKEWYNGFSWGGSSVYNPFGTLLFLQQGKRFRSYWFQTATPTFLINLLKNGEYFLPKFEDFVLPNTSFDDVELGHLTLEPLLFQTGYLTVKRVTELANRPIYHLGFPNIEVRSAFTELALANYLHVKADDSIAIKTALIHEDTTEIQQSFRRLFSSIANDNYRNNPIATYEGFYASVVYAYLASLDFVLIAEDVTNTGRIDLSILLGNPAGKKLVYIFEFKVTPTANAAPRALGQMQSHGYADKYRGDGATIHLIGMEFSAQTKNLTSFDHELAN